MFFPKSDFQQQKKGPCQDAYKQSSGVGMHQNPHFQLKPITNWKNLEIRIPSTIAIPESAKVGGVLQSSIRCQRPRANLLGVARSMDRGDAVRGPMDRARARYAVHGTKNLFVTKWVHIRHYGLILCGSFFWFFSASFAFS